jgi:hypothetical protein
MDAAVRPIAGVAYIPMFDRIVMNIVDMPVEILLIPDAMLPKSGLANHYSFYVVYWQKLWELIVQRRQ